MASFVTEFNHLEIQLEDIISATNNFDKTKVIGRGGFGKVYAGELSHYQSRGKSLVAIKRLDRRYGQGDPEFFKEIRMLSCYRHENLITLFGFCCQGGEMILIYEYASHGSLDHYLSSADLTWTQRLRICIDAAKGLCFLHDPNGTQQRVLHCDIKTANILLDKNMTAKVPDFGLSKMGPANQQYSLLITGALGTPGYCDPVFLETYSLTKESDVYSFGVVLFEVLCGRQCVENINGQLKVYVPFWKKSYEEKKLNEIILQHLMQQMDPSSLKTYSDIAFQCLRSARKERPTISRVVEELEIALELQVFPDLRLEVLTKYQDILMAVDPALIYRTGNQLKELLTKGLIMNAGKTRLSINEKGECIERIYIEACLNPAEIQDNKLYLPSDNKLYLPSEDTVNSRFPEGLCYKYFYQFQARVTCQYLTSQISYTLNLLFRYESQSYASSHNPLRYKIDGEDETRVFIIYPSTRVRQDGWFIVPLFHLTSQHNSADLQFEFDNRSTSLHVAGFEFQPSEEKAELQVFEEYQDIVEVASQSLFYTSLDELKQILIKGVHLNKYKTWFSLNEKGEHCHMISMEDCLTRDEDFPSRYESHWWSRFPAGLFQTNNKGFKTHVKTQLLSLSITYTVNLVFYDASDKQVYRPSKKQVDGSIVDLEIIFENSGTNINGVEGIMFQPLEKVEDQLLEDDKVEDIETISYSDTYWEQKIPSDYEEILKLSKDSLEWKTKKELYLIICKGFLLDNGQRWFSVDKNGKKCQMLSARAATSVRSVKYKHTSNWESSNESRFGEVRVITADSIFEMKGEIKSELVSPETTYAVYLLYKLPQDQSTFEAPMSMRVRVDGPRWESWYIYLVSPPHTPVIGPNFDKNTYNPLNRYKGNAIPRRRRSDGWMEVEAWVFQTTTESIPKQTTTGSIPMHLKFQHPGDKNLMGLIVQGVEIRPIFPNLVQGQLRDWCG